MRQPASLMIKKTPSRNYHSVVIKTLSYTDSMMKSLISNDILYNN